MDWRRWTHQFTGGTLVAVGLFSVAGVSLGVASAAATDGPEYLLGAPTPEDPVAVALFGAAAVVVLAPVFAAGTGVFRGRYGVAGTLAGTLYAAGGLLLVAQALPTRLFGLAGGLLTARLPLLLVGVLLWLALWPLSVAVGHFDYERRRQPGDGALARAGHALLGTLFPFAVLVALVTGGWTTVHADRLALGAVVAGAPFVAVAAARLHDGASRTRPRVGEFSPVERALWTLGTRPLLAVSVGVVALLGLASVATWLDLVSGPLFGSPPVDANRAGPTRVGDQVYDAPPTPLVTPTRLLGAALLPWLLGSVYVLTSVDDLLHAWREELAERRPGRADDDVEGVTVVDVRERVAGVGPPRTARAVHVLLGEGSVRVVSVADLDLVGREVTPVEETLTLDAREPVAARRGDRVVLGTAEGERSFRPYGDPDRLVAAVDRRYETARRVGERGARSGRPAGADPDR